MEHMYCTKFCVAVLVNGRYWKSFGLVNGSNGIDEGYLANGLLGTMIHDILVQLERYGILKKAKCIGRSKFVFWLEDKFDMI